MAEKTIRINGVLCDDYLPEDGTHTVTQFARCGCTQTCSCVIQAGDGIDVTGNGGTSTPYIISQDPLDCESVLDCIVIQAGDGIDITGNGGASTPYIISQDPLDCEAVQDCVGAAVAILAGDCLEYDDGLNSLSVSICAEPNGVECVPNDGSDPACTAGGLLVRPSEDAGNVLVFGTDNRLYVPDVPPSEDVERQTFSQSGTPVSDESGPWYPENSGTGIWARASLGTAGSTNTVVTFYKNGVSIGTLTLVGAAVTITGTISTTIVGDTDIITVAATTVGTGAEGLVVQVRIIP